jgi:hypothetical protein
MESRGDDLACSGGVDTISAPFAPHKSPPSSDPVPQTPMGAKDDPLDWIENLAVLLRAATCEERVIAAVKRFVVLLRERFVMGSKNRENAAVFQSDSPY